MKRLLLLLILLSSSFALDNYGYSRISIERTWTIEKGEGSFIDFTGTLAVNNSNQRVLKVTVEPDMDYSMDEDGVISLHYKGTVDRSPFVIKGTALVDVDYDTNITSDGPLPDSNLSFTDLTRPSDGIRTEARLLSDRSSALRTIEAITNWIHDSVEYDVSCWGESNPATVVYDEKRGVCVEFTHLLISMARSSGLEARYVNGYVYATSWQPHAWAEVHVPGYGWLPADATFAQVGILDSSHVAINYGGDQSTTFDLLLSDDHDITMEVSNKVEEKLSTEDLKGASISIDFDNETYVASVSITNERPEYLFGTYTIQMPDGYGAGTAEALLLEPSQNLRRYYGFNHSLFDDGYTYTVPVRASFNDAKAERMVTVNGLPNAAKAPAEPPCPAAFLLLGLLLTRAFI